MDRATSKEHIPPKCFFPNEHKENLITVKSCDLHNAKKSTNDEYLRFIIVASIGNNEVASNYFKEKVMKAVDQNPMLYARGFVKNPQKIIGKSRKNGRIFETMAFSINRSRFDIAMELMAKGLFFSVYNKKLTKKLVIHTDSLFRTEDRNSSSMNFMDKVLFERCEVLFQKSDYQGQNPEVFKFKIIEHEGRVAIKMVFYEGFRVLTC